MMGIEFIPGKLSSGGNQDEMLVVAQDARAATALQPGATAIVKVTLHDGRVIALNASIDEPRPSVKLIGKSVQASASSKVSNIRLTNQDELPPDAKLITPYVRRCRGNLCVMRKLRSRRPMNRFRPPSASAMAGSRSRISKVAVAALDPAKAFRSSRVWTTTVSGDGQRRDRRLATTSDPCPPASAHGTHLPVDAGARLQTLRLQLVFG